MSVLRVFLLSAACLGLLACGSSGQIRSSQVAAGEALWDRLGPASIPQQAPDAEASLGQLFDEPLSAASCRTHRAGLEHYLDRLPVDLGYWRTARDCAKLLDDRAWVLQSQNALDQLVSYAVDNGRGQDPWNPAPILHAWDILALTEEQDKSVKWMRYLSLESVRHFLVEASVVDARGRENREYFDLLDAMLRLNSNDPALNYPGPRRTMMFGQMEADVFDGDLLALTGYLNIDLESGEVSPIAARRALQRTWEFGLPGGGVSLAELCLGLAEANCEAELIEEVIEALIELEIAEGWALKAASVLMANGFDLDDPVVAEALEQAGQLSAPHRMAYYLADILPSEPDEPDSPQFAAAETLLQRAAELGHRSASMRLAMPLLASDDEDEQSRGLALLDQAVDGGVPFALHAKGVLTGFLTPEGRALIRRAAEKNEPQSQFLLGLSASYSDADGNEESLRFHFRQAGLGGHVESMRLLAQHYLTGEATEDDIREAEAWLLSGWMFNDAESAAWLAALNVIHPELNPELVDPGLETTLGLIGDFGPEMGMMVSQVLTNVEPFNQYPSRTIALLKELSAVGIAEASLELGDRYRYGEAVEPDLMAAQQWYELAFEQGSAEAMYVLAGMQLGALSAPDDALDSFAIAADQQHDWASNDLAYLLCTGQSGAKRDPARGLRIISALFDRTESPHHYQYSTLAACQAAAGDFDLALDNHRHALEQTQLLEPQATDIHSEMRYRLTLYESGLPYIWQPAEG
jgi:TPR repeat protein